MSKFRSIVNFHYFQYLLIIMLVPLLITGPFLPDVICVFLAILCIIYKNEIISNFYNKKIFLIYLYFIIILILSSLFSNYVKLSLSTSLFYFRFILFSLAFSLILKKNIKNINIFFLIGTIAIVFLAINNIIQYCFNIDLFGNVPVAAESGRYSGLFGDWLVAGSFLTRLMFIGLIYFICSSKLKKFSTILIFFYFTIEILGIFLSGERTSFFMLIVNILIFLFYYKDSKKIFFALLFFIPILIFGFIQINSKAQMRMFEVTQNQLFQDNKVHAFSKIHQSHYTVALHMFEDSKLIGHGARSFRWVCNEDRYLIYNGCSTHPHNFYIQLLAETGLLGFFPLFIFYLYIIFRFVKTYLLKEKKEVFFIKLLLYQTIIVNLFPLMPNGNFFNNWLNIVNYIPIALIIFFESLNKKEEKYLIKNFK